MNNLTESDIKYLRDCVLSSTLLGHEVKKGSKVLRKLDKALSLAAVVGQSEQFNCFLEDSEQGERCKSRCKDCEEYKGSSN